MGEAELRHPHQPAAPYQDSGTKPTNVTQEGGSSKGLAASSSPNDLHCLIPLLRWTIQFTLQPHSESTLTHLIAFTLQCMYTCNIQMLVSPSFWMKPSSRVPAPVGLAPSSRGGFCKQAVQRMSKPGLTSHKCPLRFFRGLPLSFTLRLLLNARTFERGHRPLQRSG